MQNIFKFVTNQPFRQMQKTYIRLVLLLLSSISFSTVILSQEQENLKELFIEAESYFLFEEYNDAMPLYQRILRIEPNNFNVIYKVGICYLNDIYLKDKSISYLEKASEHINLRYKQDNYKEKQAPIEVHYYLGRAYHVNNRLDDAIASYSKFKKLADPEEFDFDMVDDDIKACNVAKEMKNSPVFFSPKNIGSPVNTRFEEINPVISGDGKILAFTRRLQFYDAVFITEKDENGNWKEPYNLTPDFGIDGNTFTTGISYFGDELFLYRSDDYDGNIYTSKKTTNSWTAIEKLNDHINTKYWESHASPSADGQYLYFSSNRAGGYGGLDIYKSKKGSNGDWGAAVNLGPVINTPANDDTPFIGNEGHSLFFSSQNHGTMGDYDIYLSNLRSDGTWDKPRNMGYPVNSTDVNTFYAPLGVNAFGLFSLYDQETTLGMSDIYIIEVYNEMIPRSFTVTGSIESSTTETIPFDGLKILLLDTETNEIVSSSTISEAGEFSVDAQQGDYQLVVEGEGIEKYSEDISLKVNQTEATVVLPAIALVPSTDASATVVPVVPVPKKQQILVKNDFYTVTDSSTIPIELIVPKGNNLVIRIFVSDSLISEAELESVRRRFTYFYKPQPGENILQFIAEDKEGNISSTEVNVIYYQQEKEIPDEITEEELKGPETGIQAAFLIAVSSAELRTYLEGLNMEDFDDYYELYEHLIANAADGGYSKEDVDKVFAIFFSQKNINDFDQELMSTGIQSTNEWAFVRDSSLIPLEFVSGLEEKQLLAPDILTASLLGVVIESNPSGMEVYRELINFSKSDSVLSEEEIVNLDEFEAWEVFSSLNNVDAIGTLRLAATTLDLNYLHQSLLIASDVELRDYVMSLNFEDQYIFTAIDLTKHLFQAEPFHEYSAEQLIEALELIKANKDLYLIQFKEILTQQSSGSLKSELFQAELEEENIQSYEGLINYLINQSEFTNYSRENVYSLLLSLIDIEDVNEFADKITSFNYSRINEALADTSLQSFSNPLELIQYLLAVSQKFNFADTDINNLLIRMILEKGINEKLSKDYEDKMGKFWRERKFITTIILVNILLLILILMYILRRKSNS